MTTNYNRSGMAAQYKAAKQQPWRARVEMHSFLKLIGDLRGKTVLDMACGEGHFTRLLAQSGARRVVGVDLAERMIDLARAQERSAPLGIEYHVGDARDVVARQEFDLCVSAWLLVYARDRTELARMAAGLASRLRPGGRFVTFTTNPGLYAFSPRPDYRKYGFQIKLADRATEGAPILWTIFLEGSTLDIENYYLPVTAYQQAFEAAGFGNFATHGLELGPDPAGANDQAFWSDFLNYPPAVQIECTRL